MLGIVHSDISFHNLMLDGDNGILNDFDLASIVEPGQTGPSKDGPSPYRHLDDHASRTAHRVWCQTARSQDVSP